MFMKLLLLFYSFAKVGAIGYGGGPALIPLVEADVVNTYKWLTETEFTDVLAMGYALPGPIATKTAAVVGYKVAGWPGSFSALLGIVLPSFIFVMILFLFFFGLRNSPKVDAILKGIRPVVVALLALVVLDMVPNAVKSWPAGLLTIATLFIFKFTGIHPAFAMIAGGIIGFFFF